jgi:hypothetical protein
MHRRAVQSVRVAAVAALAVAATGCAGLFGSALAPSGLATGEDRLRQMLAAGQAPVAFERLGRSAPDDEMLRTLYHGVIAYHAGSFAESARALDAAAQLAEERMTKSVSRSALSLVSNDLILQYEPGPTERLMIPYYAALARIRLGDMTGAAVEARRLSLLLQQFDDRDVRLDTTLRATLRYFTGAIFEASGERNDADVAYRNAAALDPAFVHPGDLRPPASDSGTVFVVLEQGFVAHRVEQSLSVVLLPEEVYAIAHGASDDRAAATAYVAGRVIERALYVNPRAHLDGQWRGASTLYVPAPERSVVPRTRTRTVCTTPTVTAGGDTTRTVGGRRTAARTAPRTVQECVETEEEIEGLPYLLKVAWPVYRSEYRATPGVRLAGFGDGASFATTADLSRSVVADFEADRALIIARTLVRGTAKMALAKSAEKSLEEKNEVAGRLAGLLGNIGSVLLERADTRSWHLLPAGLSIVRVRLPAGEHDLSVELGNADGRAVPLGTVAVRPGHVSILPVRDW